MDLLQFWIFSQEELDQINHSRNNQYQLLLESKKKQLNETEIQFDDRIMERFYLKNLIKIVRSRKSNEANQEFFMTEKILETAVNLFKRYYLVKDFVNEEPHQMVLCAIYLAMKLEEMREDSIQKLAQKLRQKAYFRGFQTEPIHFSMTGYTERQLRFLQTINFQVNKLSLIRPIQSLLNRIKLVSKDAVKRLQIQKQVSKLIENIYFSDLFWLVHPAKLAFCVIIVVGQSEKSSVSIDEIDKDGDLKSVLNNNRTQIQYLVAQLKKLKPYNRKQNNQEQKLDRYRSWTKYFFQRPTLRRMNNSINSVTNISLN